MIISRELIRIFVCGLLHNIQKYSKIQNMQEKKISDGLKGMSPLKLNLMHFVFSLRMKSHFKDITFKTFLFLIYYRHFLKELLLNV